MVNRYETSNEPARGTIRLIWMVAFFATLALIALLGLARSAQALALPDPLGVEAPLAPDSDEPEDEAEAEAASEGPEECAADEAEEAANGEPEESDELGEGEGDEECGEIGPGRAPAQCLLTTAVAKVSASRSGKVRLLVRYTAVSPITVDVDYWLRGAKGPLTMPGGQEHFSRRGVYRETNRVTASQLAKVVAAKSFTIRLRPLGAPGYCRPFEETRLTARHASHGHLTWAEPGVGDRSGLAR
jgi:hypothetical protein